MGCTCHDVCVLILGVVISFAGHLSEGWIPMWILLMCINHVLILVSISVLETTSRWQVTIPYFSSVLLGVR